MLGELETAAADWLRDLVKRKPRPHAEKIGTPCANCGTVLEGPYCHACGQNSDDHKRSILHLVWEAFEGLFHVDGRLWRTMPALFFRPGRLAKDQIEGRAARHVPPFRTFLVSLLLFIFAAEHATHEMRLLAEHNTAVENARVASPAGRAAEAARLRAKAVKARDEGLKEAAADHAKELRLPYDAAVRAEADRDYQSELKSIEQAYARHMARAESVAQGKPLTPEVPGTTEESRKELAAKIRAGDSGEPGHGKVQVKTVGKGDWLKQGLAKALENPDYYLTVMFGWAHRLAVLLLPIVGLSLAAVYFYRRKYFLYDHLLVAMQILSFAFLTNAFGLILPIAAWPFWFGLLAIWTPINLFQTLRGAYDSSIIGALVKTLVVWSATFLAFTTLLVVLLVFTLSQV